MTYSLIWLPKVLADAGLKVALQPGWETRGRRDMTSPQGVVCHHTGTPKKDVNMPTLRLLTEGRSDLPGPLAQLGLGRDGTFYVIAAGVANHAGAGSWKGLSGNNQVIGIEAENTGIGDPKSPLYDPWPAVQLDAYQRGVAAILKHLGKEPIMCCGHKEWAPTRKIDPHTLDMNKFRAEVGAIMKGTVAPPKPIPGKDPVTNRPTLRRGSPKNTIDLVKELQKKLGLTGSKIDGDFGPTTEAAVRRFQRAHNMVADGIVGPATWAALDKT